MPGQGRTSAGLLGAALGLAVGLIYLASNVFGGPEVADDEGWVYDCPSAYSFWTQTSFIEIQGKAPPTYTDEDGANPSPAPDGRPDGRRVYAECKAQANRSVVISALVTLALTAGGAGFLVYVASRPHASDDYFLRPPTREEMSTGRRFRDEVPEENDEPENGTWPAKGFDVGSDDPAAYGDDAADPTTVTPDVHAKSRGEHLADLRAAVLLREAGELSHDEFLVIKAEIMRHL